ncbi:hypothetical protein J8I29_01310 [Labrys sp. LIt4]|uniref:hypothetical protein n=1 Tax=Labrys sp. LIt4 TaxID=2821355 RepID=UPI001AE09C58|nr:hypothetical protein [Labrys sp. LIt4]MBP0577936.1 hypothetical protein [Labrys sp. LIt4]
MSSTDYQDDPWGRHWCHAPRRNGFIIETGGAAAPGIVRRLLQRLRAWWTAVE